MVIYIHTIRYWPLVSNPDNVIRSRLGRVPDYGIMPQGRITRLDNSPDSLTNSIPRQQGDVASR